ncbi:MAG: ABC transporter substrate-binding protein [Chloroflexota bacterium]|nr:ABC transporter substrate-binding protein [Chloroflexota bacterium]
MRYPKLAVALFLGAITLAAMSCGPAATPTPTLAPTPTPAPTATPTVPPAPTATPTATPILPTPTPTPTLKPGEPPKPTPTPTPTSPPVPTATPQPIATPTATPTARPIPTATATPTQVAVRPKGELKQAIQSFGHQHFDPVREERGNSSHYQAPIYDSLIGSNVDTGQMAPGIAERWEFLSDGLTWRFYVRKGMKWHNGDPVTANDVAFSMERFKEKGAIAGGDIRQYQVKSNVIDEYTVELKTNVVYTYFGSTMSRSVGDQGTIMPKKYIEAVGADKFAQEPVGNGPWKFKKSVSGVMVQFDAWDQHWLARPNYELYTLVLIPEESTRMAALRTGALGIAMIEPDSISETRSSGMRLITNRGTMQSTYYIWGTYDPRYKDGPLANVKVREALSLAINRPEIVKYVMEGEGAIPLPYGVFRYSLDIDLAKWEKWSQQAMGYDPARAKQLMAEAGYPNGFKLCYYNLALPGTSFQIRVGEATAGYWKAAGIDVDLRAIEWGLFSPMRREHDASSGAQKVLSGCISNMRSAGRPTTLTRSHDALTFTGSERVAGSPETMTAEAKEIDRLYKAAFAAIDPQERARKTDAALEYMNSLWLIAPVVEGANFWAVNPKLVGEFKGIPGRGELADISPLIPRPDQKAWK